jgi:DNA-binding beta-propeller fold protein YncE
LRSPPFALGQGVLGPCRALLPTGNFRNMSTRHAFRLGIAVLSAVALVASGTSPVLAAEPDPMRPPLTGFTDPLGVALDPSDGTIYVSNFSGGPDASVSVFDKGSAPAARTLKGIVNPGGVAVRPVTGEVYVAAPYADSVYVFDRGSATFNDAKTIHGAPWAMGLAFDTNGDLYVTSWHAPGRLLRVPAGWTAVKDAIPTGDVPTGVAVDPRTRDVYVSCAGSHRVEVFHRGSSLPWRILTGVTWPYGIALHPASAQAFVVDNNAKEVRVYQPDETAPTSALTLNSVLADPVGLAIQPSTGEILVGDRASDSVYFYQAPVMSVSGVNPTAGALTGGTAVTITGANLGAVTGVSFGGVAATNVVAVSPTTVTAVAPAHAVGKVDVSVAWGSRAAGVAQAFEFTAVAPAKATAVSGAPGRGQVTVSWTPPADTGGVPVASYSVTPTPAGPACATAATACTIAGLTNGTKYRFVVRATNTAGLSSDSDASAEVAPYIPVTQKVKAKKASSKLPRKGFTTVVNWVKKPSYASRAMTASCTDGTARPTEELCRIYRYKTGKVKVRTKGYRNVQMTVTLQALPKLGAPVRYGPSTPWTRTWRVR